MIRYINSIINKYFKKENGLSQKIINEVFLSFGVKFGSIIVGLLLVPLTINYVNTSQYGIWLTISSMISWMSFFDVGMGNGLRNKLAGALALNKYEEANIYISTTYAVLLIISVIIFLIFFLINPFINWQAILNIPGIVKDNIHIILLIAVGCFCIQFVVQIINTVLMGCQKPSLASFITFIGQVGILIAIIILKHLLSGTLFNLVLIITIIPLVVLIIASIVLYRSKLKMLSPSIKKVDFKYGKSILSLGSTFFIIQLGALLLYQTDNIIISKVIEPAAVTIFNVAYKLFSVIIMLFSIILTPYWSAFTDAHTRNDFKWMKENVRKMRILWLFSSFVLVPVLCFLSSFLYKLWIGDSVIIPFNLSVFMGFYTIAYTGMILNCFFLNGIGKLKVQLYLYIISCIINVPLSIYFARHFGISGVVVVNASIMFIMNAFLWKQTNKILENTALGIWAK